MEESDEFDEDASIRPYQNLNDAAIVNLKAELLNKEEKFRQDRLKPLPSTAGLGTINKVRQITGRLKSKPPGSKSAPEPKQDGELDEAAQAYELSKARLAEKAKLYQELSSGQLADLEDENGDTRFLVDFEMKGFGESEERMEGQPGAKAVRTQPINVNPRKERPRIGACIPPPFYSGMVSETSSRDTENSRDTETTRATSISIASEKRVTSEATVFGGSEASTVPMVSSLTEADEIHREAMHAKWTKESDEAANDQPVHYENIRFDEIRELGVGYFAFSKNEQERAKQMAMLENLSKQTKVQQEKRAALKAKRQAALDARLERVKARRLQKEPAMAGETAASAAADSPADVAAGRPDLDTIKSIRASDTVAADASMQSAADPRSTLSVSVVESKSSVTARDAEQQLDTRSEVGGMRGSDNIAFVVKRPKR